MKKVVTFGEIMLRLNPPGFLRFGQAVSFDAPSGAARRTLPFPSPSSAWRRTT